MNLKFSQNSISAKDFNLGKQFMQEYVNQFDISKDKLHLGIVQFAGEHSDCRIETNITFEVKIINKTIANMQQIKGQTPMLRGTVDVCKIYCLKGLELAKELLDDHLVKLPERAGLIKTIILLTDGRPTRPSSDPKPVIKLAKELRAKGVTIFFIGVGNADMNVGK